MTVEKLHDAIGLLPADLIAEADKLRSGRPKVIPWRQYTTMAACFALVICTAWFATTVLGPRGATEAAMEYAMDMAPAAAAPMEQAAEEAAPEEPMENGAFGGSITKDSAVSETRMAILCHRYNTPYNPDSSVNTTSTPDNTLICSRSELEDYLKRYAWQCDFTALWDGIGAYDDAWFENHDLLLLTVDAAYPDVPYTVTSIENTGGTDPKGWDWYVFYTTAGEAHPEGETTCFHLLTELEKGLISPEDSILTIADPIY